MRKIVQISINHQSNTDHEYFSVLALCDDGTLWNSICSKRDDITLPIRPDDWGLVANVPQEIYFSDSFIKQLGY